MAQSFQFSVAEKDAGLRLDEFLASRFAALSRMRISNLIGAGFARVNGQAVHPGARLAAGDLIEIAFDEGPPTAMQPVPVPLEIVYEDEQIIVVVKPAGMLVHPTRSVKNGTLANALAYHLNKEFYDGPKSERVANEPGGTNVSNYQAASTGLRASDSGLRTPEHGQPHSLIRPGLVHRLDRATSGLMVIAKTQRALSRLTVHFRRRLVEKRYLALVHGNVSEDEGVIVAPIGRDSNKRPQWRVMEGGKDAETRFRVRERLAAATLVELEPVTGRTNQLRIHCAHAGHPILGDALYCGLRIADCGISEIENLDNASQFESAIRLCLHASRLAFHHPASNEQMEFTSPLPEDFDAVLGELRKQGSGL